MLGVPDDEWYERGDMLIRKVDETCSVEARVEEYLLWVGRGEAEELVGAVDMCVGMEEGERGRWWGVYVAAEEFLGRVLGEWVAGMDDQRGTVATLCIDESG